MAEEPIKQPDSEAEASVDPIAQILAEQKAQLAGSEDGLSEADREALAQMEASAELEAHANAGRKTEAPPEPEVEAPTESGVEVPAELEAEVPDDPIAKILAEQKAQLAAENAPSAPSRIAQIAAEQRAKLATAQAAPAEPDKQAQAPVVQQSDADETLSGAGQSGSGEVSRSAGVVKPSSKFSMMHVFLLANTLAILALVVSIGYLPFRNSAVADHVSTGANATTQEADKPAETVPAKAKKTEIASWTRARTAFAKKEYASALDDYRVLYRIARNSPETDMVADFFMVRMAQCFEQLVKPSEALKLFEMAAVSKSPIIRGVANYHMAMSAEQGGAYLRARRRAYLAAAALAGLSERLTLETDCAFLIARTLTGSALSFYGKNESISWGSIRRTDPFTGLDEGSLRRLLDDGVKEPGPGVLGPKVQRADGPNHAEYWTATCSQTPLIELLSRFATEAQTDIRWGSVSASVRNRPMNLYVRRVSGQRLCELATGSAGLIVRFTGDAIGIYDPTECESVNQQRGLLVSEALVTWRRLFLRAPRDTRLSEGHFALALLQECSGDVIGAIAEYQSMAHKYSSARLAPHALLEGAKLRIELRDYSGARKELLTLLDTYPDNSKSTEAYASLGQATMRGGKPAEAFRLFKKLFFMSQSRESRLVAGLGAGKCLYMQGKHELAVKWLNDHIIMAVGGGKNGKGNLSEAYLLLGKCHVALGNTSQAIAACRSVLATYPKVDERIEACQALAEAWRASGDLPKALAVSLQVVKEVESGEQKYQALVTAAGLYREMGVAERGAVLLSANILKTSDPEIQAKLRIELARCYCDAERFTEAYAILIEAPERLSPGRMAQAAACDLADVCLRMGRPDQAAVVADRVLKSSPAGLHSKRARKLLAAAYLAKQEYEKAASTLSNMPMDELGVKQQ